MLLTTYSTLSRAPELAVPGKQICRFWRFFRFLCGQQSWFFATRKVGSARVFQRDALEKENGGRPANRIGSRTGHHSTNDIAPAGEKFEHRASAFAQKHPSANVCPQRSDELSGGAQTPFASAYVHDSRNHHQLERGENWQVGQWNRLRADRRANRGCRFDQDVSDLVLRFSISRYSDHLDPGLIRQFARQDRHQLLRSGALLGR